MYQPFAKALTIQNLTQACSVLTFIALGQVQAPAIARHLGKPRRYPEQLLQRLTHVGLIKGKTGPDGGYSITDLGSSVSVAQVAYLMFDAKPSPLIDAWSEMSPADLIYGDPEERLVA